MTYQSKIRFLGLPLIHIATGHTEDGRYRRGVAKGWIAIGDISFGILFSAGAIAFGGIAMGGLAFGLFCFAGGAIGVLALGGLAVGIQACGGAAIAWQAALGGFAMAYEYAQGGAAFAHHVNDSVAGAFFESSVFFRAAIRVMEHGWWFILLAFIPGIQGMINRRARGKKK